MFEILIIVLNATTSQWFNALTKNNLIIFKNIKMKKVFLSAIMMIAFVGTSMANDIAEKEVKIGDEKIENSKQTEQASVALDCKAEKFKALVDFKAAGLTDKEASAASYSIYFDCMLFNSQNPK